MIDCNPMKTPGIIGDTSLDNYDDSRPFSSKTYHEAIGSLMYLATGTRPDISFIVGKLSQYNRDPREIHWAAVKRILRYLRGTSGLRFNSTPGKLLYLYRCELKHYSRCKILQWIFSQTWRKCRWLEKQ
ncbi:hypothetical protein AVEN_215390-1 [Araneus ventricosus]|uniref:Retrovirus-related Pol polyprotein from transposon TNT 1-94 n=1 Tax=Araneus ventricosus TaxID=182803 RepID=A0A4Y2GMJ6_ARAVE|nr:hypothetical protein AVEN_215390-1 [Araneus ventricosus]